VVSAAANSGSIALRKLLIDVAAEISVLAVGNCGELSPITGNGSLSVGGFFSRRKNEDFCFREGRCGSSSGIGGGTNLFCVVEVVDAVEAVSEAINVGCSLPGLDGEYIICEEYCLAVPRLTVPGWVTRADGNGIEGCRSSVCVLLPELNIRLKKPGLSLVGVESVVECRCPFPDTLVAMLSLPVIASEC